MIKLNHRKTKPLTAKELLASKAWLTQHEVAAKYVSREFQDFGLRIASQLNDMEHKSLYIKLAKTVDRVILEKALSFTIDYPKAENKGKIFMWKLKELRQQYNKKVEKDTKKEDEQLEF